MNVAVFAALVLAHCRVQCVMMTTDTEDVLRDLTPEQRAFVRGVAEGYSLARNEIQHDFERRFKQLKDETNAEIQAMRTALAPVCD